MNMIELLHTNLDKYKLLEHPFYQDWDAGRLSMEALVLYAQEYYHHVKAFPRYISQTHAWCTDIQERQVLLDNLIDEEKGEDNHPELWLRFLEGISQSREVLSEPQLESTRKLVNGFLSLAQTSYAKGLGALYAYERQTPEVATAKIEGLQKHYHQKDARTLSFFTVHSKLDEWHTAELLRLIKRLDDKGLDDLSQGAIRGVELLWGFLDGVMEANAA